MFLRPTPSDQPALSDAAWASQPGRKPWLKTLAAIGVGLLGFLLDQAVTILDQPVIVSVHFGILLPLLVALCWGGRYALIAAVLGLGAQRCWWNWSDNGWANIFVASIFTVWLTWHGWAARRRTLGCNAWWSQPYVVQLLWTIVYGLGLVTINRWLYLWNPAPWAPDAYPSLSLPMAGLILVKTAISFLFLLLLADAILHISWPRSVVGLGVRHGGRYDTWVISGAVICSAGVWLLDTTCMSLLANPAGTTWWHEFYHPEGGRLVSRLLMLVLCLASGIVVARLVRRRVWMAEELRTSEDNLRITLNSIGDAVIATDAHGRVTRLNPIAERLTGWPMPAALGRPLAEVFRIVNANTRTPCADPVAKVLASDAIVGLANHTLLLARDGREYQIADSGAPIRTSTGRIVGVVLVFRDITNEHALQQQVVQAHKLDALGHLAGGVAHDFNNMLAGILGAAELLKRQNEDADKRQHLLGVICTAANRAAELTRKLLAFGRKGTGLRLRVSAHKAVTDAIEILRHSIDKRVEIRHDLHAARDRIEGELAELQNVFLNLGINAAHAMPEGGVLEFSSCISHPSPAVTEAFALTPGPHLQISVRDTGCGMTAEVLAHIFDPFFTTRGPSQGTGLGLSVAYGTIRFHHGAITVDSMPGQGTCFIIFLPLAPSGTGTDSGSLTAVPSIPGGRGRILVVDDEDLVRETTCLLLRNLGYEAEAANNGESALRICSPGRFDAVLLDLSMPIMDGRVCCQRLLALDPRLRIVLCSGYSHEPEDASLSTLGASAVLRKPFSRQQLAEVLAQTLVKEATSGNGAWDAYEV